MRRSDAERALAALGPAPVAPDREAEPPAGAGVDEFGGPPCPQCHSEEVAYERFSRRFFYLSMLLLGFPLLWGRGRYRCNHCGYTWKRPAAAEDRTDRDANRSEEGQGGRP